MSQTDKIETFDVVICSKRSGEIISVAAATLETTQGRAMLELFEPRIVPAGKWKVGDVLPKGK